MPAVSCECRRRSAGEDAMSEQPGVEARQDGADDPEHPEPAHPDPAHEPARTLGEILVDDQIGQAENPA
jgi:hypothetical protein